MWPFHSLRKMIKTYATYFLWWVSKGLFDDLEWVPRDAGRDFRDR